jgi:titin
VYARDITVDSLYPFETPTNFRATTFNSTSITLAWNDNAGGETGYQLYRHTAAEGWLLYQTLPKNSTGYTDAGVPSNTRFTYQLRAVNQQSVSPFTSKVAVTTLPIAPTDFAAQAVSATAIRLTWSNASPGQVSYTLERRAPGGPWKSVIAPSAWSDPAIVDDTGLQPNTVYQYRLLAFHQFGSAPGGHVFAEAQTLP